MNFPQSRESNGEIHAPSRRPQSDQAARPFSRPQLRTATACRLGAGVHPARRVPDSSARSLPSYGVRSASHPPNWLGPSSYTSPVIEEDPSASFVVDQDVQRHVSPRFGRSEPTSNCRQAVTQKTLRLRPQFLTAIPDAGSIKYIRTNL